MRFLASKGLGTFSEFGVFVQTHFLNVKMFGEPVLNALRTDGPIILWYYVSFSIY